MTEEPEPSRPVGPAAPDRVGDVAAAVPDGLEGLEEVEALDDLEVERSQLEDPDGPAPTVVVFDIGEVLIDESRVWSIWADLLGVSPLTFAAVLGAAIAQGGDHADVFPHIAPNIDWEDFLDEHERRYEGFQEKDLYPDARPCLTELQELGFRLVIAGNQPAIRGEQLRGLRLPHDELITSGELGIAKPEPGFFTEVMELAGSGDPTDLLFVGDRVDNDVVPAASLGMRTCWLHRGPWGHLQEAPDDVEPDLVLDGLGELPLLLSEWRG